MNFNATQDHFVNRINYGFLFPSHHGFVSPVNRHARDLVIQVGVCSPARYLKANQDRSGPVRRTSSSVQSIDRARGQATTEADEQHALMRGLIHGAILSMAIWTAILYLTLVLH